MWIKIRGNDITDDIRINLDSISDIHIRVDYQYSIRFCCIDGRDTEWSTENREEMENILGMIDEYVEIQEC